MDRKVSNWDRGIIWAFNLFQSDIKDPFFAKKMCADLSKVTGLHCKRSISYAAYDMISTGLFSIFFNIGRKRLDPRPAKIVILYK